MHVGALQSNHVEQLELHGPHYVPAGANKQHSAVHSRKTAVHRGADVFCKVTIAGSSAETKTGSSLSTVDAGVDE